MFNSCGRTLKVSNKNGNGLGFKSGKELKCLVIKKRKKEIRLKNKTKIDFDNYFFQKII